MGILNVTPDSFSDGGQFDDPCAALERAEEMLNEGADIIDVGGESTRPAAAPVDTATEMRRVLPVIAALCSRHPGIPVSVDTSRADVARAALAAGAVMINDVSAASDPGMLVLARESGAGIALMHMRGTPRTMQHDILYTDAVAEVTSFLAARAALAVAAGIARERIWLDPGIGFGKGLEDNLRLLAHLSDLAALGHPVIVGASRKSFIGKLTGAEVGARLGGSLAATASAIGLPRAVVRVHDVAPTVQFLAVMKAIGEAA
jgi:dihydropteroate synthase